MNRAKIEDVLLEMGVPAGIKGFNCIADAIEYIDEHGTEISVTKELYPSIAKRGKRLVRELNGQSGTHLILQEVKREIMRWWIST